MRGWAAGIQGAFMPKSYPPEFRRRVIELVRTGGSAATIARDLGVSEATIYRWIAQEEVDLGERPGLCSGEHVELSRARARIRELEAELELTRKGICLIRRGRGSPRPKRIYPVIEALAGQGHSPKALCRMLDVAPSGFYYWRSKPPSIRELRHEQLGGLIADIHDASRGTYGYRRVAAELRFGHEIIANHKAVAALMRRLGLHGLPTPKPRRKGPQNEGSAASDLVLGQFSAEVPEPPMDD